MAYSITDGSYLYDIDINAIANGVGGEGVLSGCAITATGTPDWVTHVAAGTACIAGTPFTVTAADKTHDTPTSTNLRWDLLVVGTDGTVDIVKGTEVAITVVPVKPDCTASHTVIAHIYVDGSEGSIGTAQIFDARIFISPRSVTVAGTASATRLINVPVCTNSATQTTTRTTTNLSLLTISSTSAFIPSTSSTCRIWNEPGWWKLDNETKITNHPIPEFDPSARSVQYYTLPFKSYVLDCPTNRMFGASVTTNTGGAGANAVDGDCDTPTSYYSTTSDATVAWQWDMGASYVINKICVSLRVTVTYFNGSQDRYVRIQTSDNGTDWTTRVQAGSTSAAVDAFVINSGAGATCRYIRALIVTTGYGTVGAQIYEIAAYE